jgi:DnaJ-class molecular chaperone
MFINRSKCKKCPKCEGLGKADEKLCDRCGGYGSVGLKVLEQSRRATNEGRKAA